MRKLTVVLKPNLLIRKAMGGIFDKIACVELRELLRMDFLTGTKIGVGDITVKEGVKLEKGRLNKKLDIIDILEKKKDKYLCLVKVNVPKSQQKLLQLFDFDLIYDIPTIITKEKLTYSCIGEERNLKRFLRLIKLMGKVEKVIYKNADYRGIGITKSLTDKQNYILSEAMKWGYYKYPRNISTDELAKRLKISRTTLVEHLRKAENRIMEKIIVK